MGVRQRGGRRLGASRVTDKASLEGQSSHGLSQNSSSMETLDSSWVWLL